MGHIIAFVSIKGGVGKTTLALETASSLANDFGKKVLLIDANFSAPNVGLYLDLTEDLGLHDVLENERQMHVAIYEAHGFDVIPASLYYDKQVDVFKLKKLIEKVESRYDYIILDSSPNYEELKPVIVAAEKIFIVTTPDDVTLKTSMKAAVLAKYRKTPVEGIIINKIRDSDFELSLNEVEEFSEIPVVARIPDHKRMNEALFYRKPMGIYKRRNPVSREVRRFASALCGVPEKEGFFSGIVWRMTVPKEKVNRNLMRERFYESQL